MASEDGGPRSKPSSSATEVTKLMKVLNQIMINVKDNDIIIDTGERFLFQSNLRLEHAAVHRDTKAAYAIMLQKKMKKLLEPLKLSLRSCDVSLLAVGCERPNTARIENLKKRVKGPAAARIFELIKLDLSGKEFLLCLQRTLVERYFPKLKQLRKRFYIDARMRFLLSNQQLQNDFGHEALADYKAWCERSTPIIVTVDIPDIDNFLMVLAVLKLNPNRQVAIVLSPRPVDLRAVPYGRKFADIKARLEQAGIENPLRRLLSRFCEEDIGKAKLWTKALAKDDRRWFYQDQSFECETVREDTELYMQVSLLRLEAYLRCHGIPHERFCFYRYKNAQDHITIGVRHAAHKPDWTWGFGNKSLKAYKEAVAIAQEGGDPISTELRTESIRLMEEYIKETKPKGLGEMFHRFEDLIEQKSISRPDLYVGGPFTEACAYLEKRAVKRLVGMGGFIHGSNNIFFNQFNFHVDVSSAWAVLKKAQTAELDLTLIPTECVKDTPYDFRNWQKLENVIGKTSPSTVQLYRQYTDSNLDTRCTPFDFLVPAWIACPKLFNTQKVSCDNERGKICFKLERSGRIKMCWPDKSPMEKEQQTFHDILVTAISPANAKT